MLSKKAKSLGRTSTLALLIWVTVGLPSAASAEIDYGIDIGSDRLMCYLASSDQLVIGSNSDDCSGMVNYVVPTRLSIGDTTSFVNIQSDDGETDFTNVSVQFNGGTQDFTGTTTFGSTVSFNGPSVTFSNGATFSDEIATDGITNTGLIVSDSLSSGSIFGDEATITDVLSSTTTIADELTVLPGAAVTMGGNVVHGVAAGVANTDAVNVGQLNTAVAGVTTDVTALETVTATHTTQITNLQTGLTATNTAVTAETAARVAADTALDGRVDALEAITANLDDRFENVEDRADAGTATAVALSGAMFLPGKTFNLTGNVGTYRSAVAGALQIGALVSQNVALNAGVAHGFNKGGKTAVRAGFTLGW